MAGLFGNSGLSGSNSIFGGSSSILSDWAMLRSGTYKKLMKAYYAQDKTKTDNSTSTNTKNKVEERKLTAAESSAKDLKTATDALMATGDKSVFKAVESKDENGKATMDYDEDKIYKAVSKFVENYNEMMKNTEDTINSGVTNNRNSLISATNAKEAALNDMGITIKADNTLKIDEETFKKSDMSKVETMFKGNASYGYQVSVRAALIDYHAGKEADTYNRYGGYNSYSAGTNYNSWF